MPPTCKPAKSNTSLTHGGGKPDQPRPRKTEVKPFSFENRDKERYNKKEEKIKEIITQEEKVFTFTSPFHSSWQSICYHMETTLKGVSLIMLTWFPNGSKKDCKLKWNKL